MSPSLKMSGAKLFERCRACREVPVVCEEVEADSPWIGGGVEILLDGRVKKRFLGGREFLAAFTPLPAVV